MSADFTTAEYANFLAAKVVAHATAFLDGRNSAAELAAHAGVLQTELMTAWAGVSEPGVNSILDPVRLLVVSMIRTAVAPSMSRQDRWSHVMAALIDLVRDESHELRRTGVQRS